MQQEPYSTPKRQATANQNSVLIFARNEETIGTIREALQPEVYNLTITQQAADVIPLSITRHPDLIVLEAAVGLMDGADICQRVRALPNRRHTPILILVPDQHPELIDTSLHAGATDCLTTPLHHGLLRRRVDNMMGNQQTRRTWHLYNNLINNTDDAIILMDPDWNILEWNPAAERIFGWSKEEAIGKFVTRFLKTNFPEGIRHAQIMQTLREQHHWQGECNHQSRAGETIHTLASIVAVTDHNNKVEGYLQVLRDITRMRSVQDALIATEARLQRVFDHAPVMMHTLNRRGEIMNINRMWLEMTGYTAEEVVGRPAADFLQTREGSRQIENMHAYLWHTGTMREEPLVVHCKNGSTIQVLADATAVPDSYEGQHALFVLNDISLQEQMETTLRYSERQMQSILNAMTEVVVVFDREGRHVRVATPHNPRLARPAEELVGHTLHEIMPAEQANLLVQTIGHVLDTGESAHVEYHLKLDDSETRWYNATISPLHDGLVVWVEHDITDRKQAAAAAKQTSERYRQLFEYANDAILLIDVETGSVLEANRQAARLLGYSQEELVGIAIEDIEASVNMDQSDTLTASLRSSNSNQIILEQHYRRKDGTLVPVESSSRVINHNERTMILSFARDISLRKQARAAERDQRLLAEALRDTAAALNSTLKLDDVIDLILHNALRVVDSEAANIALIQDGEAVITRHTGYEKLGLRGGVLESTRLPIDTIPNYRIIVDSREPLCISDTGAPGVTWVATGVGHWVKSYLGAPIVLDGEVIGIINLDSSRRGHFEEKHVERLRAFTNQAAVAIQNARLFDRTQRYATELEKRVQERTAELEHERAQLHAILNAMRDGVVYEDNNGNVQYINRAMTEITGYDAEEWQHGQARTALYTAAGDEMEQLWQRINRSLNHRGYWTGEMELQRKNADVFDASLVHTEVRDSDDSPIGLVTVLRDISQEKQLEKQKTRFIASASHELRTPIANVKTRLYLMRRQPERFEEHIRVAESVVNWMQSLIEDMFDLSRFERGVIVLEREPVELQTLVRDVTFYQQPEAERQQINLSCELPEQPLVLRVDPYRLSQVITNLVSNAIHYTQENGRVTVSLDVEPNPDEPDQETLVLRVEDDGSGIDPSVLPHLFKPFFRAQEDNRGAGLGLTISQEIVQLHGGTIDVESELGKGSRFIVRLPLEPVSSAASGSQ